MSNFQTKLNLLDAAWQKVIDARRELKGFARSNPDHSMGLNGVSSLLYGAGATLASLRGLIQEEEKKP